MDKLAPEKETKLSLKTKHPWYGQEQRKHKTKIRRLEQKWLKHRLDLCWEAYKSERNKYYAILKCKKTECYKTKVQNCKGDSHKLHQLVNSLTSKPPEEAWLDHSSKEELVNNFAEFFECKVLTIREKFEGIPQYKTESDTSIPQLAKFALITENQVELIIKNIKSKHCELDCIPTHVLKEMMPVVLPTITKIINLSLSMGIFSEQWKTAIVKPLLKKLGLDLINSNYWPVSNLSFLSKLVAKCMWLQLSNQCQDYGLLPDYQSAYRPNYSCKTNLLKISNDILWNFECQHITSLTAMDLSAAFDTVHHEVHLQILSNKFGVTDTALNWFRSYLQPRQFKVKIGEAYSSERSLTYSAPQGSCTGANIFNLYCSPLGDTIPTSLLLSGFTDDHSIRTQFYANNRMEEIECKDHIEKAMVTTKNWMYSM